MTGNKMIRYIRITQKLSEEQLGIKIGFPKDVASFNISQFENGRVIPDADTLVKIAEVLDVHPCVLREMKHTKDELTMMYLLFILLEGGNISLHNLNSNSVYIQFGSDLIGQFLKDLNHQIELERKRIITFEELLNWAISFPDTISPNMLDNILNVYSPELLNKIND